MIDLLAMTRASRCTLWRYIAVAMLLGAGTGMPVEAAPAGDLFITVTQPITPPVGFSAMCAAHPDLCRRTPRTGTGDDLRLLDHINRTVNHSVHQETDLRAHGRDELWVPAGPKIGAVGDCEDIALEKRAQLVAAGFDPDRLFLAVGYARRIGLHVVLVARTGSGDLILDSRAEAIRPWRRVPYSWIGVQSSAEPAQWFGVQQTS